MTQNEILSLFKETHALLDGHFQLTSGLHSPQYFQCVKVMQYPTHAEQVCSLIADHFAINEIGAVVAPALGGIMVGYEVARHLSRRPNSSPIRMMFTERKDGIMQLRRGFDLNAGERVLICEDVITTGGSVAEVINIVRAAGAIPVGVGCIVDRSGGTVMFDVPGNLPFATLRLDVVTYLPDHCPMCVQNIPLDKPGSRVNN